MTRKSIISKIHLIISIAVVVPAAVIYGFHSSSLADIQLTTIDEKNVLKAIMGLYLGFSVLWILGVFKANYLKSALISNLTFMLGLGFGRTLSILFDGAPSLAFGLGTLGELALGFYGLWVIGSGYSKKP